jgi:predicted transcriptional regulator
MGYADIGDGLILIQEKSRGRDRQRIYYDILCAVLDQENQGDAKITRVQNAVNLPSDRFRDHLERMIRLGLVKRGNSLNSTAKGRQFVSEYKKILHILKRFGLD